MIERRGFEPEHEEFRRAVRRFLEREIKPHADEWEHTGLVDRQVFVAAGEAGFIGFNIPEEYGGGGRDDFRFNQVLLEEVQHVGVNGSCAGIGLHNDVCVPYFLHATTVAQKAEWLPGVAAGTSITAIAMTEPGAGSDLAAIATSAVRDGDYYIVNGSKTFITSGLNADLVVTAVKTDTSARHRGISLLVIERGMPGFTRSRKLDKIGAHAQDTAELFFSDVRVPVENRLGDEGEGFRWLVSNLPQERLSIAVTALAAARAAFETTLAYARDRHAFGQAIGSFQHNRFRLAEMATEIDVAQPFIDQCVAARNEGRLSPEDAAKAKWWCTELQGRVVDACVQMHGGYGYMAEQPIARAFVDARVTRIYGGTNEIMKELIGRSLGV
jgi:alkylation response protein AidB-like acyl-CoA dehydrogenase